MHAGHEPSYPKHASQGARREARNSDIVASLCRHFAAGSAEAFDEAVHKEQGLLRDEGLMGLVLQLRERFQARAVGNLTATYLTLSLDEVARQAKLPDAGTAKSLVTKRAPSFPAHV